MGAPKIKIYQLERGYDESVDNDIQRSVDDELLPVVDKPITPEDFYLLTPIKEYENQPAYPVAYSDGRYSENLTPDNAQFQAPEAGHTDILIQPSGNLSFRVEVYDYELNLVDDSEYQLTPSGVLFNNTPYPSGARIKYWRTSPTPNSDYAMSHSNIYDDSNWTLRPVIFQDGQVADREDYTLIAPSGLLRFNSPVATPSGTYATIVTETDTFAGHHENWVNGHMYLSPDVFVGMHDYPGDDTRDDMGNPVVQGPIPEYVEPDNYQIDFRRGVVTFPSIINSAADPVHASFAYVTGVRNITGQQLEFIESRDGKFVYKAVEDNKFPESISSMWIGVKNDFLPRNIYVDGDIKPKMVTVAPYDSLTIKNG